MSAANQWMVCENANRPGCPRGFCIYRLDRASKLYGNHERCIRHHALLRYEPAYNGLARDEVREREEALG